MGMSPNNSIAVWDILVRIFHWTLVACFAIAYFLEGEYINLHVLVGSIIVGLLLFRLIWGFIGTPYSRFADFLFTPMQVIEHLLSIVRRNNKRVLGHTPAGSYMIFALLIGLALLTLSGVLMHGLIDNAGPLAGFTANLSYDSEALIREAHEVLANLLLLMVVLHIGGVLAESLLHRESLIISMITGKKRPNSQEEQ